MNDIYFELTAFSIAVFCGIVLIPLMIRIGHRYNLLDLPGQHKRHKKPVPILGGVGLFAVVWLSIGISTLVFPEQFTDFSDMIIFILLGALIILLVGLSDDMRPLPAWVKLIAQCAAGYLLYLGGVTVEFLTIPTGSVEISSFSPIITIVWVVMLTNAINLIDGLDGLASGVSLIGAISMLVIGHLYEVGGSLIFILPMAGYLFIFLFFNRYPAKIFLGDSGSMQIGYYFAVYSLIIPLKSYTLAALYLPLLALGVPLLEVFSSFVRRFLGGKNIMKADRRHLFHYLTLFGLSPNRVVSVFYLLATIYGAFAIAMFYLNRALMFGIFLFFMVVIFSVFYIFITKLSSKRSNFGQKNNVR
ncbi:MAG: undecaprenyl/decaprenyl-phosphate alpha-N-acetylglucosaminyl 1-phosphate transferase [Calditrichaeota bacterium]|nr:MAG: undecaprenyl/decaprenyl-phosphate alpha-N-acetylglucosaminyl 1-phosphate transferase [Calditrichota bacterium]